MEAINDSVIASWNVERSSDHLQNFVVSRLAGLTDVDIEL